MSLSRRDCVRGIIAAGMWVAGMCRRDYKRTPYSTANQRRVETRIMRAGYFDFIAVREGGGTIKLVRPGYGSYKVSKFRIHWSISTANRDICIIPIHIRRSIRVLILELSVSGSVSTILYYQTKILSNPPKNHQIQSRFSLRRHFMVLSHFIHL